MTPISATTASPLAAAAATASTSPALIERLTPKQHASFMRVWERLPSHLRAVAFDRHGPDWALLAIEQLGDTLCDFPGVFSKSETDFGSCSVMTFESLVPEGRQILVPAP